MMSSLKSVSIRLDISFLKASQQQNQNLRADSAKVHPEAAANFLVSFPWLAYGQDCARDNLQIDHL